jgi:hypothetical protein
MKIVINKCYGGFGLSKEAYEFMGLSWDTFGHADDISRADEKLIECVEKLGEAANGAYAQLSVITIPDNTKYIIDDYDGIETVHEEHKSWG